MSEVGIVAKVTWREGLVREMEDQSDPGPLVAVQPAEAVLDQEWDTGWPPDVTVWTERRVYFAEGGDRYEYLASAPRNPPV